jgi:ABC-type sulfate/molybdate transport systems ATPase subunit
MGDSGSGKTTILRIISGLIRANSGIVKIDNDEVDSKQVYIEPFKRSLGFVFQEASLWPHMTVAENVKFGIKEKDKVKTSETLEQIMEQTNTINFRNKYPSQISGGQAKRVSIARALAAKPKYVLLDEPLVNLDQKAKIELLDLLVIIKEKSDAGFVYVSHQKDEIDYLGSTLWILEDGRLVKDE